MTIDNGNINEICSKLVEVTRLEEKVNQHKSYLAKFGDRLDKQEHRMHESELWQAHQGDKLLVNKKLIADILTESNKLRLEIDEIKNIQDTLAGQRDITKEVLKWVVGILGAILTFKLTQE